MVIDEISKGMASSTEILTGRISWQRHNNWFNMAFYRFHCIVYQWNGVVFYIKFIFYYNHRSC
jgi:hypothetical protein